MSLLDTLRDARKRTVELAVGNQDPIHVQFYVDVDGNDPDAARFAEKLAEIDLDQITFSGTDPAGVKWTLDVDGDGTTSNVEEVGGER